MCITELIHLPSSASPLHQRLKTSDNLKKDEAPEHFQHIDNMTAWEYRAEEVFDKGEKIIQILFTPSLF